MTCERERCELTLTCWLIVIACVASSSARFHNLDELVLLNTEAGAPRAHQSGGSQPDAEGIAGKLLASAPDVMKLFRAQDSSARSWPGVDSLPPIPLGEVPFLAAIGRVKNSTFRLGCSGALISRTWVLTSAQCMAKSPQEFVILGERRLGVDEGDEQVFGIRATIPHKDFSSITNEVKVNDLALVLLDGIATFNDKVQPVSLPGRTLQDELAIVAAAWGDPKTGLQSTEYRKSSVQLLTAGECRSHYAQVADSQVCTISTQFHPILPEPGSPLVCASAAGYLPRPGQQQYSAQHVVSPHLCGLASSSNLVSSGEGRQNVPLHEPTSLTLHTQISKFNGWIQEAADTFLKTATDTRKKTLTSPAVRIIENQNQAASYPFLGLVKQDYIRGGSTEVPTCLGVLLKENMVLTSASCVYPASSTGNCISVSFAVDHDGNKAAQVIPVSKVHPYFPQRLVERFALMGGDEHFSEGGEAGKIQAAVVLRLARNVNYWRKSYPVNLPRQSEYIGMKATLVSLARGAQSQHVYVTADLIVRSFKNCPSNNVKQFGLTSVTGLCAKLTRESARQFPERTFLAGSALLCHPEDEGTPFICGILTTNTKLVNMTGGGATQSNSTAGATSSKLNKRQAEVYPPGGEQAQVRAKRSKFHSFDGLPSSSSLAALSDPSASDPLAPIRQLFPALFKEHQKHQQSFFGAFTPPPFNVDPATPLPLVQQDSDDAAQPPDMQTGGTQQAEDQLLNVTMAPAPATVIGNFPGQIVITPTASFDQPWERDTWLVFRKVLVPQLVLTDGPELLSDKVLASLGAPSAVQDQANSHACGAKMQDMDPASAWTL